MTTRRFPKLVPLLCAAALSFGALACGDDDDDDDDVTPDADTTDAPGAPDAGPDAAIPDAGPDAAVSTRSGSVSILQMALVDSAAAMADWYSGAFISISYTVEPPVIEPDVDTFVPPGVGCQATLYDLAGGDALPVQQNEGAITVTGDALLSPIGNCVIPTGGDEYVCIFGANALAVGDSICAAADACNAASFGGLLPAGTAAVTIASGTFDNTTKNEVGMYIQLTGGGLSIQNTAAAVPIVDVLAPTTVLVGNPAAVTEGASAAGTFVVVSGAGPHPSKRPFLDGTAGKLTIVNKTAGGDTEALTDVETAPGGEGFVMDDATLAMIRSFPFDSATDITFSCSGAGGVCGPATTQGTIVVITSTNGSLAGAGPFDLPPGAQMVSISCRAFGPSVVVPVAALDLIEGTTPTRIRTTLFRANFALAGDSDGTNQTGVVAGYGYTGFSTP